MDESTIEVRKPKDSLKFSHCSGLWLGGDGGELPVIHVSTGVTQGGDYKHMKLTLLHHILVNLQEVRQDSFDIGNVRVG